MSETKGFTIQVNGLITGKHEFEFPVDYSFFESFGNKQVFNASLVAEIELEKGVNYMSVNAYIQGSVTVECDRCLDKLELPVEVDSSIAVKSTKLVVEISEEEDEYILVDTDDGELDLKQFIYDEICINLPIQCVHEEGECNAVMIDKLKVVDPVNEEGELSTGNSPFGALKSMLESEN